MLKRKKVFQVVALSAVIAITSFTSQAATFTKKSVDSNAWTYVTSGTKQGTGVPSVQITDIYKADGSDSNYSKIKVRIKSGSTVVSTSESTTISISATKATNIPIESKYKVKGTSLTLEGMGNNASLDCKVTGTFYVD